MLEALDLKKKLSKSEYKKWFPALQWRLHRLQRACWEARIATVAVFEGWDTSGRGSTIRKLTQRLEPRGFSLHLIRAPRTFALHLPWMWRFWTRIPNWGEIAIFDRSWYGRVLVERVLGLVDERSWREAYGDIISFERGLVDDRYHLVKFFFHITKEEQRRRLKKLEAAPETNWQVEKDDWEQHEKYDDYLRAAEKMLERTESEWGPWTLVEATDQRWARLRVFETLIASMEAALDRRGHAVPAAEPRNDDDNGEDD